MQNKFCNQGNILHDAVNILSVVSKTGERACQKQCRYKRLVLIYHYKSALKMLVFQKEASGKVEGTEKFSVCLRLIVEQTENNYK